VKWQIQSLLEWDNELICQPGSHLRYVGDIADIKTAKKLLYSWDITTLSALVRIMILQHVEIMQYIAVSASRVNAKLGAPNNQGFRFSADQVFIFS